MTRKSSSYYVGRRIKKRIFFRSKLFFLIGLKKFYGFQVFSYRIYFSSCRRRILEGDKIVKEQIPGIKNSFFFFFCCCQKRTHIVLYVCPHPSKNFNISKIKSINFILQFTQEKKSCSRMKQIFFFK